MKIIKPELGIPIRSLLRYLFNFFYLIVASPLNFFRTYTPLLKDLKKKKIATECVRYCINQLWYFNFNKLVELYGFRRARNCFMFYKGLGQWKKENFYIDYFSYLLYGKYGVQWTVLGVTTLVIAGIISSAFITHDTSCWKVAIFAFLVISSSYYTDIFVFLIKPEIIAWPFFLFSMIAIVTGNSSFFFFFGILAILGNFTVGLLLVMISFAYLLFAQKVNSWTIGLFAFYCLYTLVRMFPALRLAAHKRILQHINSEETRKSLKFGIRQWCFLLFFFIPSIVWVISTRKLDPVLIIVASSGLLYFIFYRIIMFGDYHTIFRLLLLSNLLLLFMQWDIFTAIAILVFLSIGYIKIDPKLSYALKGTRLVPYLPVVNKMRAFFNPLPNGARMILEKYDADRRSFFDTNESWIFLAAMRYGCIEKNLCMVPNLEMFDVPAHVAFIKRCLCRFNPCMSISEIEKTMRYVGADYIVSFSDNFRAILSMNGFVEISKITEWSGIYDNSENIPPLYIFKSPWNICLIDGAELTTVTYNSLQFIGPKGVYEAKVKYYPQFEFFEDGKKSEVIKLDHELGFFRVNKKTESTGIISFK